MPDLVMSELDDIDEGAFNPFEAANCIGLISEVGHARAYVGIGAETNEGYQPDNFRSRLEPICSVGDFLIIEGDPWAIFAQLTQLNLSSRIDGHVAVGRNGKPLGTLELLATINMEDGEVTQGLVRHPNIDDKVYLAHPQIVQHVIQYDRHLNTEDTPLMLDLGYLPDKDQTPVTLTPERVFGSHCAILGATGSGKSWSMARLMEECAAMRSKVILFDATGEFYTLQQGVHHVHIGLDTTANTDSEEVVVPYYDLTESDLFAIFKPAGQSQAPKLKAAMKSLKLAQLAPGLAVDGVVVKAHKSKALYEEKYVKYAKEVENPYATFDIRYLTRQIEHECVNPQRSQSEPMIWGGPNSSEYSYCVPLINRIEDIIKSPSLEPIFTPRGKKSLFKAVHDFFRDDTQRILRISLKHLSFAYQAREIVANAMGRHLMELARAHCFRELPVLVALDEAHQFLNQSVVSENSNYSLDSFGLIAKEGRKYALSICLATQRPRDLPEDVLSQIGTLIVHRLINDKDRSVIERASGNVDRSAADAIPTLSPGEVVMVGVGFPVPMFMRIQTPQQKPDSRGANYQTFWR
jgi:DNA helicase HerA-like ATPase